MYPTPHPPGSRDRTAAAERLLLDVSEVACMLGVGRSFVYELLARGELEHCKLGSRTKIPQEAVRTYVARRLDASRALDAGVMANLRKHQLP